MKIINIDSSGRRYKQSRKYVESSWNKKPLSSLRDIIAIARGDYGKNKQKKINEKGYISSWRDDFMSGSIGIIQVPDIPHIKANGYIVITYYKDRGTTDKPIVLEESEPIEQLEIKDCELIADYYLSNL